MAMEYDDKLDETTIECDNLSCDKFDVKRGGETREEFKAIARDFRDAGWLKRKNDEGDWENYCCQKCKNVTIRRETALKAKKMSQDILNGKNVGPRKNTHGW